jgi:phosphate starvation-inducible PhoH-like protein
MDNKPKTNRSKKKSKIIDSNITIPNELEIVKFDIKNFEFNQKQKDFLKIANDKDTKLLIVDGPAGTSKTLCAVHAALWGLKKHQTEEIIYIRTAIESGDHSLGFLPGDLDEKLNPYLTPLHDKLEELLNPVDIQKITPCIKSVPVNFIRGHSWRNKFVIADEMQNASLATLKTFLTRIGTDSKVFMLGDRDQSDLGRKSGFGNVVDYFDNDEAKEHGIHVFRFTEADIVRSEICKYITTKFKEIEFKKFSAKNKPAEAPVSTLLVERYSDELTHG